MHTSASAQTYTQMHKPPHVRGRWAVWGRFWKRRNGNKGWNRIECVVDMDVKREVRERR